MTFRLKLALIWHFDFLSFFKLNKKIGKIQEPIKSQKPVLKICRIRIQDLHLEPVGIRPDFFGLIRSGFNPEIARKISGFGTRTTEKSGRIRSSPSHYFKPFLTL
ncbi:unnamed protein product [Meloidogyne enterolobii]|uniref:Uncharacterized protein n=1 Tax=Meloidogyne enterolobii TaxID=390850 RepID=A0ACB0Z8E2_MELEN